MLQQEKKTLDTTERDAELEKKIRFSFLLVLASMSDEMRETCHLESAMLLLLRQHFYERTQRVRVPREESGDT